RPRDIIFFFNSMKNIAVARGHQTIEETDIQKAFIEYSNWVFKSLIVENGITMDQMHDFLYNLLGEESIIVKERIVDLMKQSNIDTKDPDFINYFLDKLVSLTLLGREVKEGRFDFVFDFESDDKNKTLARKLGSHRF